MLSGTFATRGPGLLGVALAHGLGLAVMVCSSLGAISGGHFSPRGHVSRAVDRRQDRPTKAVLYG